MTTRRVPALILVALSAGVGSLTLTACGSGDDPGAAGPTADAADEPASSGERLPEVAITPLRGGDPSNLADIEGPAVVNLWATWCAPCRREIPDFEEVHQARGDTIRFVGINVGEDAGQATQFLDDLEVSYDQFLDPEGYVVTELNATAMPVTIVIDAAGEITLRHLGPLDQNGLNEAIDEALAG